MGRWDRRVPGLVTAVAAGSITIQATVGSIHSSTYPLTISSPVVSLTNVTLATTGGVTCRLALGGDESAGGYV